MSANALDALRKIRYDRSVVLAKLHLAREDHRVKVADARHLIDEVKRLNDKHESASLDAFDACPNLFEWFSRQTKTTNPADFGDFLLTLADAYRNADMFGTTARGELDACRNARDGARDAIRCAQGLVDYANLMPERLSYATLVENEEILDASAKVIREHDERVARLESLAECIDTLVSETGVGAALAYALWMVVRDDVEGLVRAYVADSTALGLTRAES